MRNKPILINYSCSNEMQKNKRHIQKGLLRSETSRRTSIRTITSSTLRPSWNESTTKSSRLRGHVQLPETIGIILTNTYARVFDPELPLKRRNEEDQEGYH